MLQQRMHGFVVFDNNAYKRISVPRLDRIVEAERAAKVIALANIAVLQELLARVLDEDSEQRSRNRAAARKMGRHCGVHHSDKLIINFLSDTDLQVYRLFRGGAYPADAAIMENLSEIVGLITAVSNDDPLVTVAADLTGVREFVARAEETYIERLQQEAGREPIPNRMKRNLNYAEFIVRRAEAAYRQSFARRRRS